VNDATAEYRNEMRYRMTERQSGYKGGEFHSIQANRNEFNLFRILLLFMMFNWRSYL